MRRAALDEQERGEGVTGFHGGTHKVAACTQDVSIYLPAFAPRRSSRSKAAWNRWVDILPKQGAYSGRMSTKADVADRDVLLQGTLDLLVLRILALGPHH